MVLIPSENGFAYILSHFVFHHPTLSHTRLCVKYETCAKTSCTQEWKKFCRRRIYFWETDSEGYRKSLLRLQSLTVEVCTPLFLETSKNNHAKNMWWFSEFSHIFIIPCWGVSHYVSDSTPDQWGAALLAGRRTNLHFKTSAHCAFGCQRWLSLVKDFLSPRLWLYADSSTLGIPLWGAAFGLQYKLLCIGHSTLGIPKNSCISHSQTQP